MPLDSFCSLRNCYYNTKVDSWFAFCFGPSINSISLGKLKLFTTFSCLILYIIIFLRVMFVCLFCFKILPTFSSFMGETNTETLLVCFQASGSKTRHVDVEMDADDESSDNEDTSFQVDDEMFYDTPASRRQITTMCMSAQ